MMKINGACYCGQLSYVAEIDPAQVTICHCTDCQSSSGSAYRSIVPAIPDTLRIQSGLPKIYVKTAESGNKRDLAFCPECGTHIYSGPHGESPGYTSIRLGTVSQRNSLKPQTQIWCDSAQDWVDDLSEIPKKPKQK